MDQNGQKDQNGKEVQEGFSNFQPDSKVTLRVDSKYTLIINSLVAQQINHRFILKVNLYHWGRVIVIPDKRRDEIRGFFDGDGRLVFSKLHCILLGDRGCPLSINLEYSKQDIGSREFDYIMPDIVEGLGIVRSLTDPARYLQRNAALLQRLVNSSSLHPLENCVQQYEQLLQFQINAIPHGDSQHQLAQLQDVQLIKSMVEENYKLPATQNHLRFKNARLSDIIAVASQTPFIQKIQLLERLVESVYKIAGQLNSYEMVVGFLPQNVFVGAQTVSIKLEQSSFSSMEGTSLPLARGYHDDSRYLVEISNRVPNFKAKALTYSLGVIIYELFFGNACLTAFENQHDQVDKKTQVQSVRFQVWEGLLQQYREYPVWRTLLQLARDCTDVDLRKGRNRVPHIDWVLGILRYLLTTVLGPAQQLN